MQGRRNRDCIVSGGTVQSKEGYLGRIHTASGLCSRILANRSRPVDFALGCIHNSLLLFTDVIFANIVYDVGNKMCP